MSTMTAPEQYRAQAVDRLRRQVPAIRIERPADKPHTASPKSVAYAADLAVKLGGELSAEQLAKLATMPQRDVSGLIRAFEAAVAKLPVAQRVASQQAAGRPAPMGAPGTVPEVAEARYMVGEELYRVDRPEGGKWAGWTFVKCITTGDEVRVRGAAMVEVLTAIAADPEGCLRGYGRKTGVCGCCGRKLTNPESVAKGIGPICEGR